MKVPSQLSPKNVSTKPRKPRVDGVRTRQAILQAAVNLATAEGLSHLTIGRMARHVGMSKSGLFAHFGSKEELQLAVIEEATQDYLRQVYEPTLKVPSGLARLEASCELMLSFLEHRTFPGICFYAMVRAEYCAKPGILRDKIMDFIQSGHRYMAKLVTKAQAMGELDRRIDPELLAFELEALCDAPNWSLHEPDAAAVLNRARIAVRNRIQEAKNL